MRMLQNLASRLIRHLILRPRVQSIKESERRQDYDASTMLVRLARKASLCFSLADVMYSNQSQSLLYWSYEDPL